MLKKAAVLCVLLLLFSSCASGREVSGAPPVGIQAPAETQIPDDLQIPDDTQLPDETQIPVDVEEEMPPPFVPPSSPSNLRPPRQEPYTVLPMPEDERLLLRNENGDILYLGMSLNELGKFFGETIEDGIPTKIGDSFEVLAYDGVVTVMEANSGWSLGEIAVGDNIEKVREIFGEDYMDAYKGFPEEHRLRVNAIAYQLDSGYLIKFYYGNDGIITGFISFLTA